MAVRSKDFVGIAENIRSRELSGKEKIENLKNIISKLFGEKSSLNSTISYLEAALAAAYESTDENGDLNYGRIASLERQISNAQNELHGVEKNLDVSGNELNSKQNELELVEEEKAQALFEIQERARKTSTNINLAGGMYGAYSGVGSALQNSLQSSLSSLRQAAGILGGSVDGAAAGGIARTGSGLGGSSSMEGNVGNRMGGTEAATLAAFSAGHFGDEKTLQASRFSTEQGHIATPAMMMNFHPGKNNTGTISSQNFVSDQSAGLYAASVFAADSEKPPVLPGIEEYLSGQESQESYYLFSQETVQSDISASSVMNKTIGNGAMYQSEEISQDISAFSPVADGTPMIARHGYNSFTDNLIVQDWELGRYSEVSESLMRKRAASEDYNAYLKNPGGYKHISYEKSSVLYIDPAAIMEIRGMDDPNFWSHKSTSYSDYIDMARQIPCVYTMVREGYKLSDLAKREDIVGACARNYFLNDDITAMRVGNAFVCGDNGHHRIMAALIAGVNIPVRVTDEFVKEQKLSSVSEKGLPGNFREEFAKRPVTVTEKIFRADKTELAEIVKNEGLAKNVDFGNMDIKVAREFVETIWETKDKYPFLSLPFIGSRQVFNNNLRKNIEVCLTRLYKQSDPASSTEENIEWAKMETDAYMKKYEIEENVLAVSIIVKKPEKISRPKSAMAFDGRVTEYVGEFFASKQSGISINTDHAEDYTKLCQCLLSDEHCGKSPKGCNSISYITYHEIAHQLDDCLQLCNDPEIKKEYDEFKKMSRAEQIENLCTYANESINEFIAEAWAESQCSSSPRRIARLIAEKVSAYSSAYMKAKKGNNSDEKEKERLYK